MGHAGGGGDDVQGVGVVSEQATGRGGPSHITLCRQLISHEVKGMHSTVVRCIIPYVKQVERKQWPKKRVDAQGEWPLFRDIAFWGKYDLIVIVLEFLTCHQCDSGVVTSTGDLNYRDCELVEENKA